jgi:hypothetical protein
LPACDEDDPRLHRPVVTSRRFIARVNPADERPDPPHISPKS